MLSNIYTKAFSATILTDSALESSVLFGLSKKYQTLRIWADQRFHSFPILAPMQYITVPTVSSSTKSVGWGCDEIPSFWCIWAVQLAFAPATWFYNVEMISSGVDPFVKFSYNSTSLADWLSVLDRNLKNLLARFWCCEVRRLSMNVSARLHTLNSELGCIRCKTQA